MIENKTTKLSIASESRPGSRGSKKRNSKSSRSSKSLEGPLWIPPVKEPSDADPRLERVNYREVLTNFFFGSLFEGIVVERKSLKSGGTYVSFSSLTSDSQEIRSGLGSRSTVESEISRPTRESSQRVSGSLNRSSQLDSDSTFFNENYGSQDCSSDCSCYWRIIFSNGNYYEGQTNGNLMHGKGEFRWSNGTRYKGYFKDGYPCGKGKMALPDLSTYEGDFCLGFFHGIGALNIKSSPNFYNGQWKVGEVHGKGWMVYDQNDWYEGEFERNMKHGFGYRVFKNGTKFKGQFSNDKINGEGTMIWYNNDYYVGEWNDNYQNGYGEYIWNLIPHKSFAFVNYNWYKGNWIDGMRSGAGIMSFGYENGSKLAGTWEFNKKHGAGLVFCGNGVVVQRNPLFTNDKPCTFIKADKDNTSRYNSLIKYDMDAPSGLSNSPSQTYKNISEQIRSKDNLTTINKNSLTDITRSATTIKMAQYLKLLQTNTGNNPPLKIPIHNIIENVDLSYFIENVLRNTVNTNISDMSQLEIQNLMNCKSGNLGISLSYINYLSSNQDICANYFDSNTSQTIVINTQELRDLITVYLPQLREIYRKYSSLGVTNENLPFEPVLVRFFLWQLYRDIGVTEKGGLSIVEVDEVLGKNPNSCLETTHNPWEPIYFWQFLQALVGVCCLLFNINMIIDFLPSDKFLYRMFKQFLDYRLFPRAGNIQGNCLTHLKDLVPIESVYCLYKEIGEPHTVDTFLRNTYLERGSKIPCYKTINNINNNEFIMQIGINMVGLNNKLHFSQKPEENIKLQQQENEMPRNNLYTFSGLGRRHILKTLCKICPQIATETKHYVLNYRLSFIEFYEALLLLSYEKVEQERLELCKELTKQSLGLIEIKSTTKDLSKTWQNDRNCMKDEWTTATNSSIQTVIKNWLQYAGDRQFLKVLLKLLFLMCVIIKKYYFLINNK